MARKKKDATDPITPENDAAAAVEEKAAAKPRKKAAKEAVEAAPAAEAAHDHDHGHDHHDHDHDHDHDHGHHHHHDHDHAHEDEFEFVDEPNFEIDYKGDCLYEVKASVPASNEKKQAEKVLDDVVRDADVPGFRRGKAPRKLVERRLGKAIRSEVTGKIVDATFKKLIKDKDMKPLALPNVEGLEKEAERATGEPLTFSLKFEVLPKVDLGKYRGVKIERPVVIIDDKDVVEAIDGLRERQASFEAYDGAAKDGDQVVIDFSGKIDGEEFNGGSAQNYPYILGSKRFFAEFEKALVGTKTGKEVTTDVTFPEDYSAKHIAGKTATFTIKIQEVKRKQLPELTDEFAKGMSYESVEDMKQKIADELRQSCEAQSNRVAEQRALDIVVEAGTFELPKTMIDSVTRDVLEDEYRRLLQMRIPAGDIDARVEDMEKAARETAVRDIKRLLVLNEIGEAEGVEVTEDDFEQELADMSARTGVEMGTVERYMQKANVRSKFESRIFRAKSLAVLMEHVIIENKEVPREELEEHQADNKEA